MQSINDVTLKFLGRYHTSKGTLNALKNAQQHFNNASVDIIFACAYNNLEDWSVGKSQYFTAALTYSTNIVSSAFVDTISDKQYPFCVALKDRTSLFGKKSSKEEDNEGNHPLLVVDYSSPCPDSSSEAIINRLGMWGTNLHEIY